MLHYVSNEPMQELVLVRHAAASGQEANAALTTDGERQSHALADLLMTFKIRRVISSPVVRAIETVAPFCARTNLHLETDIRLAERVLGPPHLPDWREHLRRSFDDMDYCMDDGESSRTAQARGIAAVQAALSLRERCVVVTHGNLLALILKSVDEAFGFDQWSKLSNPDVFVLRVERERKASFSRAWNEKN